MGVNPLDDLSTVGRQNLDGVLMLFHSIEHGILAETETDRLQNPGRAGKYKNKSCNVPAPEASNQGCEDDVETYLVRRWWKHDVWNLYTTMKLCVTTGSGTNQLDTGSVSVPSAFFFFEKKKKRSQCTKPVLRQENFWSMSKKYFIRDHRLDD